MTNIAEIFITPASIGGVIVGTISAILVPRIIGTTTIWTGLGMNIIISASIALIAVMVINHFQN